MGRLPFDPGKMRSTPPPSAAPSTPNPARQTASPDALSVSAFARLIERTVATAFPDRVTVRGEVSGARHRTHFYFNLKDDNAVIGAVMFASAAKRSAVKPTDGRTVLATGKLEYYAPSGRLSLIVEKITEDGQGSLEARFRALCDDLRARGWFDPDAKQTIPAFPGKIAVVTAAGSAALHDVLDTANQRCPAVELMLVDVPVQGDRAAPTITRAIAALDANARDLGIDAILLTRGGGSVEDLWAFNDPDLAAAIHRCRVPLVAAIGHESDTTIAELVADHRAATPTQATVRLTPDRAALAQQLGSLARRRERAIAHRLELESRRLTGLARTPAMADPAAIVGVRRDRLARAADRLARAVARRHQAGSAAVHQLELTLERHRPHAALARRKDALDQLARDLTAAARSSISARKRTAESLAGVLHAIDPTAVLERGYSITVREDGSIIRDPAHADPGSRILTRLASGSLASIVEGAETGPQPAADPGQTTGRTPEPTRQAPTPKAPRRRAARPGDTQPSLFAPSDETDPPN